jgi:NADPH:quinone reductase-like Zn-dependent oxidoreductase
MHNVMGMMKAVVYDRKSVPDRLIYQEVEKPEPGDGEVLIRIVAVSVNAADYRSIRMGIVPKRKIFGADISGIVEDVGKNIRQYKPGDEVIGDLADYGFGGFAEYVVAPEKALVSKPAQVTFDDAAALPMAALTALQGLRDKGKIQPGQKVLIAGSGGGVGTFAVQFARYFGAVVTAVCSSNNIEQARALGADQVIDYTREDFTKSGNRYDLILGINGNRSLYAYRRAMAPHGRYVMIGGSLTQISKSILFGWAMSLGSRKMEFLAAKSNQEDLEFIVKLVADGKIKPVIERHYSFNETIDAIRNLSKGHAQGKAVINVELS